MSAPSDKDAGPAGSASSNGGTSAGAAEQGVLSQLPRTRPQRPSARQGRVAESRPGGRTDSRRGRRSRETEEVQGTRGERQAHRAARANARKPAKAQAPQRVKAATPHAPRRAKAPAEQQVPRQGFESESDRARGPVRPPGGTELLTSAAEIVGELTKAGFSTGERLLRSLLPRS